MPQPDIGECFSWLGERPRNICLPGSESFGKSIAHLRFDGKTHEVLRNRLLKPGIEEIHLKMRASREGDKNHPGLSYYLVRHFFDANCEPIPAIALGALMREDAA